MSWRWWERDSRKLSKSVKQYLQKEFGLLPGYLECLMMVTKRGLWCGKPAIFIRIYDAEKLEEEILANVIYGSDVTYESFELEPDSPSQQIRIHSALMSGLVLYEGYQQGGFISLTKKNS
jgi:hypothetical protein